MILDKVQDLVVEVGVGAKVDFLTCVVVAVQVTWLRFIIVVVVGDGEMVVSKDDVGVGHFKDDGGGG